MEVIKYIYVFAGLFFGVSLTAAACAVTFIYYFMGD